MQEYYPETIKNSFTPDITKTQAIQIPEYKPASDQEPNTFSSYKDSTIKIVEKLSGKLENFTQRVKRLPSISPPPSKEKAKSITNNQENTNSKNSKEETKAASLALEAVLPQSEESNDKPREKLVTASKEQQKDKENAISTTTATKEVSDSAQTVPTTTPSQEKPQTDFIEPSIPSTIIESLESNLDKVCVPTCFSITDFLAKESIISSLYISFKTII